MLEIIVSSANYVLLQYRSKLSIISPLRKSLVTDSLRPIHFRRIILWTQRIRGRRQALEVLPVMLIRL